MVFASSIFVLIHIFVHVIKNDGFLPSVLWWPLKKMAIPCKWDELHKGRIFDEIRCRTKWPIGTMLDFLGANDECLVPEVGFACRTAVFKRCSISDWLCLEISRAQLYYSK